MSDMGSVLVVGGSVTQGGKIMGRIGMDIFGISTGGVEITSKLLFVRHLVYTIPKVWKEYRLIEVKVKRMKYPIFSLFSPFYYLIVTHCRAIKFHSKALIASTTSYPGLLPSSPEAGKEHRPKKKKRSFDSAPFSTLFPKVGSRGAEERENIIR
jgi:hypothetical protein